MIGTIGKKPECVVFGPEQLLPEEWRANAAGNPVRTFNPGLLRDGEDWVFAYRVVAAEGNRRIAICRLDRDLCIIEGSQRPLSDHVRFRPDGIYPETATRWFADPRLYRFGERLFVYWNSGWHEPHNCQFVQELDPATLLPIGHPRELILNGERQKLEKNWTFFAGEAERTYAVYSITPHRVLEFSTAGDGDIVFDEVARVGWSLETYPKNHGGLRGGAPPCMADGLLWSFCHSVHDGADGYRYAPAVYAFEPLAPFSPMWGPVQTLELGNPFGGKRTHERLNPAVGEVIYPCGAARDGARWLVSHGINDEYCAISRLQHVDVLATLQSVSTAR